MVYSKQRVDTDNDYESYNSSENKFSNQNFFSNRNTYDNEQTYNPFATASSVQTEMYVPEETETEENSSPDYEYEREYNPVVEQQAYDESLNPFKAKPFEIQNIQQKTVSKTRIKLNSHGKIIVSVYSAICAILIAFIVYNAVLISGFAVSNAAQSAILNSKQEVINVLEQEYNYLGSDEGVSAKLSTDGYFDNYVVASENNSVTIYLGDTEVIPTYEIPSNWFDKVCEFFSGLFN